MQFVSPSAAARLCVPLATSPPHLFALSGACVAAAPHIHVLRRLLVATCLSVLPRQLRCVPAFPSPRRMADWRRQCTRRRVARLLLLACFTTRVEVRWQASLAARASSSLLALRLGLLLRPRVHHVRSVSPRGPRLRLAQALKRLLPHAALAAPRRRARALPPLAWHAAPLRRTRRWRLQIRGRSRMPTLSTR